MYLYGILFDKSSDFNTIFCIVIFIKGKFAVKKICFCFNIASIEAILFNVNKNTSKKIIFVERYFCTCMGKIFKTAVKYLIISNIFFFLMKL